ncbi:MAG: Yip1 family protein [Thermodesulfobacteriota bacterium]
MNIIDRVKKILLQPKIEWETIATETTTTSELYRSYIMPLAAIGPVASIIGMSIMGISTPFSATFRIPLSSAIGSAALQYLFGLIGVYVMAMVIDFLAPKFAGERNLNQALKLAAYSYTAAWLSGIFILIPALSVLTITGLYSLYLLYTGIPVLMKSPREKSLGYTVAAVIAAIVLFMIIGWLSHSFISYPSPMYLPK